MSSASRIVGNTRVYYLSKFGWIGITITSIFLSWQIYGLSFVDILLLQGIFGLFMLFFEFPSGIIADIGKRKDIVSSGYIMIAIGSLIYGFADNFTEFVIAEAFFALGLSFISGSDSANLWDTFLEDDNEIGAKKTIAKGRTINILSAAVMISIGGLLSSINLILPFYICAMANIILAILWYSAYEPERIKQESKNTVIKDTVKLLHNNIFLSTLFAYLILSTVLRILFWAYIPKMQRINLSVEFFGIIIGLGGLVAGSVSAYLSRKPNYSVKVNIISYISAFIGTLLFVTHNTLIAFIIALVMQQIARGIISVDNIFKINEVASSDIRASAISMNSSIGSIFYLIFTFSFSIFELSFDQTLIVNLLILIVFYIIMLLLKINSSE